MINIPFQLSVILPEIIIALSAMFILLVDLYIKDPEKKIIYALSQLSLLVTAIIIAKQSLESTQIVFNGMYISDNLASYLKLLSLISSSIVFIYAKPFLQKRSLLSGEYFSLSLFSLLGIMLMISGNNLLIIYMGLELLSLCLYALVAINRDNLLATEAAMKYFVLGALASGLLLYGMSMIYGITGSLDLNYIASEINQSNISPSILAFGLVFIVVGIAFKFGAVPFQMWVPDIYQGATLPMTMMISSVPKFASVALLIRILFHGLESSVEDWQQMLLIMALLSMLIGNIAAIAQTNIKRMLAYSTISHVGFIFFGFMSGTVNGVSASLFYVTCYALMSLAAFGSIIILSNKDKDFELIDDFKGLSHRNPTIAFLIMLTMLSLAGIPPTVGFYAKFSVLQAAIDANIIWPTIIAVIFALIGMYYYLRIIKIMYFDKPLSMKKIVVSRESVALLFINSGSLLILGLSPKYLMSIAALAASMSI